jgi:hypothetical protein
VVIQFMRLLVFAILDDTPDLYGLSHCRMGISPGCSSRNFAAVERSSNSIGAGRFVTILWLD